MIKLVGYPDNFYSKSFLPCLYSKKRYLIMMGGAGSSKSRTMGQKILDRVLFENDASHRILIVRKTIPANKKSCWALINDYIVSWKLTQHFKINKTDLTMTFLPNGNQIYFVGLDDTEKIKSIERITSIWIEEATEISKSDFMQLNLRLRGEMKSYKQIALTFNPIDINSWINSYFFEKERDDCFLHHSTVEDNEFIDVEYVKLLDELAGEDETYYNIYRLGKWGVLKNIIYTNYEIIDKFPENCDEIIYGLDFGFNNESALIKIGEKDQDIYEQELLYKSGLTNADLIIELNNLIKNKNDYIYADSAEPARIEEIQRDGFNIYPSNKSVKDGIDHCKRKKAHITKDSINLIRELKGYKYKETKDGIVLDDPVKFRDHLCDGRRYARFTHWGGNQGDWGALTITGSH